MRHQQSNASFFFLFLLIDFFCLKSSFADFGVGWRNLGDRGDGSVESLSVPTAAAAANANANINEILVARAQLDTIETQMAVEAQLQRISVPISLVLLTMLTYLIAGSVLFSLWENWTFLDSFYFCYISLTTIVCLELLFFGFNLAASLIFNSHTFVLGLRG